MGDKFVASEPSKSITYLDANNLYGWAMSKPLPTHGFKWMKVSELETWELYSCILEVDLEYPRSLPPSRTGGRIRRLPSCRVVKPHQWTRLFAVGGDS